MSFFRSGLVTLLLAACLAGPALAQDSTASALPADTAPTAADNLYVEQGNGAAGAGCPGTPTSSPECNALRLTLGTLQTFVLTGLTLPAADVTGLGTAATVNTGTSGAVLGLLNGANTYSGNLIFSGSDKFTSALAVNLSTASPFYPEQFNVQNVDGSPTFASVWASQALAGIVLGETGGTFGTPTATQSGYNPAIDFCGYGSAVACGALIEAEVTANWSVSNNEMEVVVKATPAGSTSEETEAKFQAGLGLGSNALEGVGTINASGYYAGGTAGATKTCSTYPTVKDGLVTSC